MPTLDSLAKTLEEAATNLVNVKITTQLSGKNLQTTINMAAGDITMVVDPEFLQPDRKWLLDLHLAREKQGTEILKQNLAALSRLVTLIPAIKEALKP